MLFFGLSAGGRASAALPPPTKADSLRAVLRQHLADSVRARLLCRLAAAFAQGEASNVDSSLACAQRALRFARRTRQPRWEAQSLVAVAEAYDAKFDFKQAEGWCAQAIAAFRRLELADAEHNQIRRLGMYQFRQSRYPEALAHVLQALRYYEHRSDSTRYSAPYAQALVDVAMVYSGVDDNVQTEHYFKRWLAQLARQPAPTWRQRFDQNMVAGNLYNRLRRFEQSLTYLSRAEKIYRGPRANTKTVYLLLNLGNVCVDLKKFRQAKPYLVEALALSRQLHLDEATTYARTLLAPALDQLGETNASMALMREAVAEAEREQNPKVRRDTYRMAAYVYDRAGQYRTALDYLNRYLTLQDSMFSNENRAQVQAARAEHERYQRAEQAAAHRLRLAQLHGERRVAQLWAVVLALLLLAGATAAWVLVRQRRLRAARDTAELRARQAELEAEQLRAQEALRQAQYELARKNGQLASLALSATQQDHLIESVKEELRSVAQASDDGAARNRLQRLQQNIAFNAQAGRGPEGLHQVLGEVHPSFFAALQRQYPTLTLHERRLAGLLRLDLTSKDIAAVLNISEDSVKKARYRLRRKLGLTTEESLAQFLFGLSDEPVAPAAGPAPDPPAAD